VKAPSYIAIAAMAQNRVIGNQGKIPWHLPDDFKWFKETTLGHILVMGRKTFESIGRPLPGRQTIIISRSGFTAPSTHTLGSLAELASLDPEGKKVFIAGGAEIYQQALPQCSELYLTVVKRTVEGDAFFPAFEESFEAGQKIREHSDFDIWRYLKTK
jgi:dihydrofolate reductase